MVRACAINSSSPPFSEMEFTTHLPCTHFKPASMISHLELSIMMGTRAISGSAATRFKNVVMASTPSIIPSSILISMICAPPSTWSRATSNASSKLRSLIRRKNFLEPVTLVRSPTFTKLVSGVMTKGSKPERRIGRFGRLCDIGTGIVVFCQFSNGRNVRRRSPATTADNINEVQF